MACIIGPWDPYTDAGANRAAQAEAEVERLRAELARLGIDPDDG